MKVCFVMLFLCRVALVLLGSILFAGCKTCLQSTNGRMSEDATVLTNKLAQARMTARQTRPIYDRHVGAKEPDIVATFSSTPQVTIATVESYAGEMYTHLKNKLAGSSNGPVKELFYEEQGRACVFWLVRRQNQWVVVSDIEYPLGLVF